MSFAAFKDGTVDIEIEALLQECPVCYEEVPSDEFVSCKQTDVGHRFCRSCAVKHAETTLADFTLLAPNAEGLRCMDGECDEPISLDVIHKNVGFDDLTPHLPAEIVAALRQRMDEDKEAIEQRALLGDSVDVSEPAAPSSSDPYRQVEEKLSAIFIRRCPHCKRALTKTTGCAAIRCPCGTNICFGCNRTYTGLRCPSRCIRRITLAQDRAALKRTFDEASPEQRAHLRSIHHGIENYGSARYKVRDFCNERFASLICFAVCAIVIGLPLYALLSWLDATFEWGKFVLVLVDLLSMLFCISCCAYTCVDRIRRRRSAALNSAE